MNYERMDETEGYGCTEDIKPPFNIAIVYDDRVAATRAMNVFTGLIRQFGDEFDFQCDLWRFDVLELPEVLEAAVQAGAAADLIIVSARCDHELPAAVTDWLNQCVAMKTPGSAALVGLLEARQRSGDIQRRTRHLLQGAADRSLMDFFLSEVDLPRTSPALTPEDVQARANTVSPLLQGILRQAEPPQRPRV